VHALVQQDLTHDTPSLVAVVAPSHQETRQLVRQRPVLAVGLAGAHVEGAQGLAHPASVPQRADELRAGLTASRARIFAIDGYPLTVRQCPG
jgi:hypothetical protein